MATIRKCIYYLSSQKALAHAFFVWSALLLSCQPHRDPQPLAYQDDSVAVADLSHQAQRRMDSGDFPSASRLLDSAVALGTRREVRDLSYVHFQQGITSAELGGFDKALDHLKRCVFKPDLIRSPAQLHELNYRIGQVYYRLNNVDQSLRFYEKVIEDSLPPAMRPGLALDIALSLAAQKKFDSCRAVIKEAERKTSTSQKWMAQADFVKATLAQAMGDDGAAIALFHKASAAAKRNGYERISVESDLNVARIMASRKDFRNASNFLKQLEDRADAIVPADLRLQAYGLIGEVNLAKGNFEKGTVYQSKFIGLRDHVYGEELLHKISALQVEFEERHQVQKINEQTELMHLQEAALHQERMVNVVIGLICALLIVILAILVFNHRTRRRLNAELDTLVRAKTGDLEREHSGIVTANRRRAHHIKETASQFRGPLATLKGICHVGRRDPQLPASHDDLDLIEETANKIENIITPLTEIDVETKGALNASTDPTADEAPVGQPRVIHST